MALQNAYIKTNCNNYDNTNICDVISEKVPYGGKNIIGPDQTPRMMRGV